MTLEPHLNHEKYSLQNHLQDIWLELTTDEQRLIADPDQPDPEWMADIPQQDREYLRVACREYLEDMSRLAEQRSGGWPMPRYRIPRSPGRPGK